MNKPEITNADIIEVIQDLSTTIAKHMDMRFEQVDKRFEQVDTQFRTVNARLDLIETDLAEIKQEVRGIREQLDNFVTRDELEVIKKRLTRIEHQLGLK